jgi:hypothetical protein
MKRKTAHFKNAAAKAVRLREEAEGEVTKEPYDLSTPLWSKYYHAVRKSIRFPRYYKHEVNW